MAQRLGLAAVVAGLVWTSGCAMCCAPYDDHYPYVGGRWVRDNPVHGRVGSAFAPAGFRVEGQSPAIGEPTPADGGQPITPRRNGASYLPVDE
jgi:hypothetical protein